MNMKKGRRTLLFAMCIFLFLVCKKGAIYAFAEAVDVENFVVEQIELFPERQENLPDPSQVQSAKNQEGHDDGVGYESTTNAERKKQENEQEKKQENDDRFKGMQKSEEENNKQDSDGQQNEKREKEQQRTENKKSVSENTMQVNANRGKKQTDMTFHYPKAVSKTEQSAGRLGQGEKKRLEANRKEEEMQKAEEKTKAENQYDLAYSSAKSMQTDEGKKEDNTCFGYYLILAFILTCAGVFGMLANGKITIHMEKKKGL